MRTAKRKKFVDVKHQLDALTEVTRRIAAQLEQTWVTVAEFARERRVHPATVRRAVKRGELDAQRIGRRIRIRVVPGESAGGHAPSRGRDRSVSSKSGSATARKSDERRWP